MGKRELVIVAIFAVLGAIAYQLTAPAPKAGERRFSWSALTNSWRRAPIGAPGRAEVTSSGPVARPGGGAELTITGASRVIVVGEARADVAWTLRVQAQGGGDDVAHRVATATTLKLDDLGTVTAFIVKAPPGERPVTTLTLRVPSRETLRVDGATQATISGIAGLRLDASSGDTTVTGIGGSVTGTHRNGALTVSDVGAVTLSTVGSNVTLTGVRGEASMTVRNGACRVVDAGGVVSVDASNAAVSAEFTRGAVRLGGTNGAFTVISPRGPVRIDAHSARVIVTLDVAIPVTATTSDASVRLALDGEIPIELDAATEQGEITATGAGLTPQRNGADANLRHAFGHRARVTLRNARGAIEIVRTK